MTDYCEHADWEGMCNAGALECEPRGCGEDARAADDGASCKADLEKCNEDQKDVAPAFGSCRKCVDCYAVMLGLTLEGAPSIAPSIAPVASTPASEKVTTAEVSITLPTDATTEQVVQAAKAAAASAQEAAPDATVVSKIVSKAEGKVTVPEGKETEVLAGIDAVVCAEQDDCVVAWVTTGRRLRSDRRLAEETYEVTQTVTVSASSLSPPLMPSLSRAASANKAPLISC